MKKQTMFKQLKFNLGAFALVAIGMGWAPSEAAAPNCASLPTDPQLGLQKDFVIKSATSAITTTAAQVQYCRVTLVYGTSASENITIAVGLPLSEGDGGSGDVRGAWNGRTQGLGGGGCAGNLAVDAAVDTGYVGSGTDGGHSGGDCTPGVFANGTYNLGFIEDFFRVGIKQQILWSKKIAAAYYGLQPVHNYWNGCSTGGRQGYLLAQELGNELDGILASAPAMYWTRFQTAQMWGQIAMFELAGEDPPGAIPYSYTSHMFNDVQNTPLLARPDVNMVDLSGSIISSSGKATFTVGGTNATDKRFVTTGQPQIAGGVIFGTYNAPREWYATLGIKY